MEWLAVLRELCCPLSLISNCVTVHSRQALVESLYTVSKGLNVRMRLFAKQVFPRLTSPGDKTLTAGRLPFFSDGGSSSFVISGKQKDDRSISDHSLHHSSHIGDAIAVLAKCLPRRLLILAKAGVTFWTEYPVQFKVTRPTPESRSCYQNLIKNSHVLKIIDILCSTSLVVRGEDNCKTIHAQ